jgi:hypothetical protein
MVRECEQKGGGSMRGFDALICTRELRFMFYVHMDCRLPPTGSRGGRLRFGLAGRNVTRSG